MSTATPWNDLRLAFNVNVGTLLSAASRSSVAARDTWTPFDKLGKEIMLGMAGVGGALGSLDTGCRASVGVEGTTSCETVSGFPIVLGRYFLERANCRFHAATLIIPINAQYTSRTGRLHVFLPSSR